MLYGACREKFALAYAANSIRSCARPISLRPRRGSDGRPCAVQTSVTAPPCCQVVTTENVGTFTIVDLAGSERVKKSGASGQTMNEAQVGHPRTCTTDLARR